MCLWTQDLHIERYALEVWAFASISGPGPYSKNMPTIPATAFHPKPPLSKPVANSCRRADGNQSLKPPRQPTQPMALTVHRRRNKNTLCVHHATLAPAGGTTAKRHGVARTSTGSSQSLWQPMGNTMGTMFANSKHKILDDHLSIQDVVVLGRPPHVRPCPPLPPAPFPQLQKWQQSLRVGRPWASLLHFNLH